MLIKILLKERKEYDDTRFPQESVLKVYAPTFREGSKKQNSPTKFGILINS